MKRCRGFMLLEILVAVTILSVGVVIAMTCIMRSLRGTKRLETMTTAALLAQSKLNDIEAELELEMEAEQGLTEGWEEGNFTDLLGETEEAENWTWEYALEQVSPASRPFDEEIDEEIDLAELWRLTLLIHYRRQESRDEMVRLVTLHTPRAEEVYVEELE